MITRIKKIKDFGIFKDFSWDAAINSFKKRNLIYGWNYSGKTTFSKLFSNLEKKKQIDFPNAEYAIEIDRNNETFHQTNLESFPYLVKVFNNIYETHVFAWDNEKKAGIQPIQFYLGEKADEIQPKIGRLKEKWLPKFQAIKESKEREVKEFDEYTKDGGKFSREATAIRKNLNDLNSNKFDKSHFKALVEQIKSDLGNYTLSTEKEQSHRAQSVAINEYKELKGSFAVVELVTELRLSVKEVLQDTSPTSVELPELDEKPIFEWVQTGLEIHKDSPTCLFCNNALQKNRVDDLNRFYSKKLREIQTAIQQLRKNLTFEWSKLNLLFPHGSQIAKHLRDKYEQAVEEYNKKRNNYGLELDLLELDLQNKENSYFVPVKCASTKEVEETVFPELQIVNQIIDEHNEFVRNFEDLKQDALEKYLLHCVAKYLITEDYVEKEAQYISDKDAIKRSTRVINAISAEILELDAQLKNTVKGQEELNTYLRIFLGREDITIDIFNEKYVLKRNGLEAFNLSEGEKTAIALSYFLTELESLKRENKLKDTVIFFDDPISSLDSNHIFQVRSLIQHFFSNESEYLQLFISTHNFEFLSVMLDSNLFRKFYKVDTNKCPFYLVARQNTHQSVLKNLPISLRSHKSEYAHLFSILNAYNDLANKDEYEYKILLPNALRRFLELYTLFKYPKGYCEVDDRIKEIFSPAEGIYHNTKLYHWFSHQNQFEKVAQHDSKLLLIDEAINEVIEHIKNNDSLHWRGLTAN